MARCGHFFVGVKIGTNGIQKVLNKGKTVDETKSEKSNRD